MSETRPLLPILDLEGDFTRPVDNTRTGTAVFFCICIPTVIILAALLGILCVKVWVS